jgi:hypothetical protein
MILARYAQISSKTLDLRPKLTAVYQKQQNFLSQRLQQKKQATVYYGWRIRERSLPQPIKNVG